MSAALAIQRLQRDRGWSRNEIAREFLKRYRFGAKETKRDARSLGAEIRRLEAGNAKWFANRPEAARLIAEILECSQAELGITTEDAQVTWPDFPELRALDLSREDPFDIHSWASVLRAAGNRGAWIVAPSGSGKTLFSRWAESRGLATCIAASTLEAAEAEIVQSLQRTADARPVLIDLADARGALDVSERVAALRVVVLAVDPPPATSLNETRWMQFAPDQFPRDRFVDWLASRIEEGPEVSSRFRRELAKVDPSGTLIATPDAVLQFLGSIFEKREVDTVEAIALRAGSRAKSKWLRANGAALFRALVGRRWMDITRSYGQSVRRDVWEGYVPTGLVAPRETSELRQVIARIKKERTLDIDVAAAQLTLDAQSVVGLLIDAGLLRSFDDKLDLRPQWLAHLETGDFVKSAVSSMPLEICATCVDPARRSVIVGVLVALKARVWQDFLRTVLESEARDLGRVAAIECAYSAAALRHERELPVGDPGLLGKLWLAQQELLEPRYSSGVPEPLTRPGAASGFLGGGAYVADCWAWSLMIPKPAKVKFPPWMFPAWEPAPEPLPDWMSAVDRDPETTSRLTSILPKLLARWTPRELSSVPLWMWPSILTASGQWEFQPSELRFLTVDREANALAAALEHVPDDRARVVMRRLWIAILQWEAWAAFNVLRGPLADRMFATFDPAQAVTALGGWARAAAHDLSLVPQRLRGHVVTSALDQDLQLNFDVARHLSADDEEVLIRLCSGPRPWTAIERAWELVPERANRELTRRLSAVGSDGDGWLEGPPSVIEQILEFVESMRAPHPDGVRRWAARRLIQHPWLAARLLAVLTRSADR